MDKAIVFTATKRGADRLAKTLFDKGHPAAALHGDMNQNQRNRAITNLRSGQVRLLVATDVAARGIDVSGITHVINFDLPKNAEDYVHRIGRTGRAGAKGIAISFAAPDNFQQLRDIERYTHQTITAHVIPGLEPTMKPRQQQPAGQRRGRSFSQKPRHPGNAPHSFKAKSGESHSRPGQNTRHGSPGGAYRGAKV
jgi:superfamily II DNA/RNA helicase